jgi:hypothetical protein
VQAAPGESGRVRQQGPRTMVAVVLGAKTPRATITKQFWVYREPCLADRPSRGLLTNLGGALSLFYRVLYWELS